MLPMTTRAIFAASLVMRHAFIRLHHHTAEEAAPYKPRLNMTILLLYPDNAVNICICLPEPSKTNGKPPQSDPNEEKTKEGRPRHSREPAPVKFLSLPLKSLSSP